MKQKCSKASTIIGSVEAVIATFMILVVTKIAPVCSGMLEVVTGKQVHMKCYYTGVVFVFLGILVLVNAILFLVTKQKLVCGVMAIALAIFVHVTLSESLGIGICANPDMACNLTAPYAKMCATIEMILGAISVFLGLKKDN